MIKNMLSDSCIKLVWQILNNTRCIKIESLSLGEAFVKYDPQRIDLEGIDTLLKQNDFALLYDEDKLLVEQAKATVIQYVFHGFNNNSIMRNKFFWSDALSL